jgi:hypothetical protein
LFVFLNTAYSLPPSCLSFLPIAFLALTFIFVFWWHWVWTEGLMLGALTAWATLPACYCVGYFWDQVSWAIFLGWLSTAILLISAYWVASIIGMSYWCPASLNLLTCLNCGSSHFDLSFLAVLKRSSMAESQWVKGRKEKSRIIHKFNNQFLNTSGVNYT